MNRKKAARGAAVFMSLLAAAEAGSSVYFYRRTMIRNNAKMERTMKMAGTDWTQHMPFIQERKEYMMSQPHEDVWVHSDDGLKLHATWFPQADQKKIVICFHGCILLEHGFPERIFYRSRCLHQRFSDSYGQEFQALPSERRSDGAADDRNDRKETGISAKELSDSLCPTVKPKPLTKSSGYAEAV